MSHQTASSSVVSNISEVLGSVVQCHTSQRPTVDLANENQNHRYSASRNQFPGQCCVA